MGEPLVLDYSLYEACKNKFLIVRLTKDDWLRDYSLRNVLVELGVENKVDSILVLTGDPEKLSQQGYHYEMCVFEPRGKSGDGLAGGVSTMCGNGVRAVASFIKKQSPDTKEAKIMTLSGLRTVKINKSNYTVNMGETTTKSCDLKNYVDSSLVHTNNNGNYINSPIPKEILNDLFPLVNVRTWSIGLNGSRSKEGSIDGEPHVVIQVFQSHISGIKQLRTLAVTVGPLITKNTKFFPKEINVNLMVVDKIGKESEILNCTHERNLGDDADFSVTNSCGTGSVVAASLILKKNPDVLSVVVHCIGGNLKVSKALNSKELLLEGPAEEIAGT